MYYRKHNVQNPRQCESIFRKSTNIQLFLVIFLVAYALILAVEF